MYLYDKLLSNQMFLDTVEKIENIKFITNGKWDWEHGLGHYKRVAEYVRVILLQLDADEWTIDLGMTAALLHDIGLSKGDKVDHAVESSKIFVDFICNDDVTHDEVELLRQVIFDHSKGNNIQSLIGLSLVLADKLDVTYHRTVNSGIQDKMNKEIQKIQKVDINITDKDLIVQYTTNSSFNVNVLKDWPKTITIPYKVSEFLNKSFKFIVNNVNIDVSGFIY